MNACRFFRSRPHSQRRAAACRSTTGSRPVERGGSSETSLSRSAFATSPRSQDDAGAVSGTGTAQQLPEDECTLLGASPPPPAPSRTPRPLSGGGGIGEHQKVRARQPPAVGCRTSPWY
eukprot:7390790-Prymnesium_polylepis.1